eukprot:1329302-Amphidinium_carterae.1
MVLDVIVVTRIIDVVVWDITQTLRSASFVRCLGSGNPSIVRSCARLLGRLKSAHHMKWSAT